MTPRLSGGLTVGRSAVADQYGALYSAELLERYEAGERDFCRINLYRAELEFIAAQRRKPPEPPPTSERHNPLWCDFLEPVWREFEWDSFGNFIPTELDDIPPIRDLGGACLAGANLDGSYLAELDLNGADLRHASIRNAIMINVDLRGADLSYADLRWTALTGDLSDANFYMAKLQRSHVLGRPATNANFGRAKLRRADLHGSDLRHADFSKTHFDETNLNETDLREINFSDVELNSVYLTGARIDGDLVLQLLAAMRIQVDGNDT